MYMMVLINLIHYLRKPTIIKRAASLSLADFLILLINK